MRHRTTPFAAVSVFLIQAAAAHASLVVTPMGGPLNANAMAQALLSDDSGIVINSASYTGVLAASGTFSGGDTIVGIDEGILLTSGAVSVAPGPNDDPGAGPDNGAPGNAQLDALIAPGQTQDASVLTVNFTPSTAQIQFSYVFTSEEYNEYVGSPFNDVFAFFVGATNYAVLPGTNTPVAINNVNCGFGGYPPTNCNYFIDNDFPTGSLDTQYDGMTTVLTFTAPVNPGVQNTMRLAIADVTDGVLDSAVFLLGGSLTDVGGCIANAITACLLGNRYEVRVRWTDYQQVTRDAFVASAGTPESALFYYQNANNWEFLIKIIDACSFNNRTWVYFAAATDVGYVVTVRDTGSGLPPKQYTNPLGTASPAVNDSNAFANCV
jgi:hypothetical protein